MDYCNKGAETIYLKTAILFTYFASFGKERDWQLEILLFCRNLSILLLQSLSSDNSPK